MNKSEMKEHLIEKGFSISSSETYYGTTYSRIMLGEIEAGYLYDDEVHLFDDTEYKRSSLTSVLYTNPRCLERVDRMILYLKTSELRRERRMRRERADQVRQYFSRRKNAVNEEEQFMLAQLC